MNNNDLEEEKNINVSVASKVFNFVITVENDRYLLKRKDGSFSEIPDYCNNISRCYEIIRHLKNNNIEVSININTNTSGKRWNITFRKNGKTISYQYNDHLAKAFAKAVLSFIDEVDDDKEAEQKHTDIVPIDFS